MTDVLDFIIDIMPVNSGFNGSDFGEVLENSILPYFQEKYESNRIYESFFITLATGRDLERIGKNYGVFRLLDESDDDYRARINFQADKTINMNNVQELGCEVVCYVDDYDLSETLLSNNITEANKILIIAPNNSIKTIIEKNLLLKSVEVVVDGW